ncbi:MAG: flavodoxin family protein [Clostridia bacterium]|nr:flavodoxin family protein [Clostridia bacterium]
MKTLIFNGSPRAQGNTAKALELITANLQGEYHIVNAYDCDISACTDCRYCWNNKGCSVNDGMQEVYDYIQSCDNVVIASPIYFSELTGKLLDVGSRFQTYYCARKIRNEQPAEKPKKGAVILVGGGDGNMNKAYETACTLLEHINCTDICKPLFYHDTNSSYITDDEEVKLSIKQITDYLNEVY